MSDEVLFHKAYTIQGNDFNHGGEASTDIKTILSQLGVDPSVVRRLVIASFEAEMNIVMYANEGQMDLYVHPDRIRITLNDNGQGIEDIELAMQEGYSTATEKMREMGFGAGMGLPNMKRNSDVFNIDSTPGEGTSLEIIVHLEAS
jgi:serine/threonine-protein kinase RsbT